MKDQASSRGVQDWLFLMVAAIQVAACSDKPAATYEVVVRVESDPEKPLAGARLATQRKPLGESDATGAVSLQLAGNPGDLVVIETSCPAGYRPPKEPLQVVLRPIAERKRPEFRVSCQPLTRSMVLAVRAQNGVNLPVRYLGKEIARTDDAGAAHALLEVTPGETVTVTLDTFAQAGLMPQTPEFKVVVPERDEIVSFEQTFLLPKAEKAKRPARSKGPQKIVGSGRR